jgi:phage tail sheath gpL-like
MTISFDTIPPTVALPLFYLEFAGSRPSQLDALVKPMLLIGQMNEAAAPGTAVEGTKYLVTSAEHAETLFGVGSELALMAAAVFANFPGAEVYALPAGDAASGVAATGTLTVSGTATAAGTIYLRVAGRLVTAGVAVGDDDEAVAASIEAALDAAAADLPVTAGVAAAVVTCTARNKGTIGNQITLSLNAKGADAGEAFPAGISVAAGAANLSSGATDNAATVWTNPLAAAGAYASEGFDVIVLGNASSAMITALQAEVVDRWDYDRALDGVIVYAVKDSAADHLTFAAAKDSRYQTFAALKESASWLSMECEYAAAYAAQLARSVAIDPARPLQTLPLLGVYAGTPFDQASQNTLANGGCTNVAVDRAGAITIASDSTTSEETVSTPFNLSRFRRRLRNRIVTSYPRHKLADDGTPIGAGQAIVTPAIIKAAVLSEYRAMETAGLVEDAAGFKDTLQVERNEDNPNRVDVLAFPDFVDQFRIGAFRVVT